MTFFPINQWRPQIARPLIRVRPTIRVVRIQVQFLIVVHSIISCVAHAECAHFTQDKEKRELNYHRTEMVCIMYRTLQYMNDTYTPAVYGLAKHYSTPFSRCSLLREHPLYLFTHIV